MITDSVLLLLKITNLEKVCILYADIIVKTVSFDAIDFGDFILKIILT